MRSTMVKFCDKGTVHKDLTSLIIRAMIGSGKSGWWSSSCHQRDVRTGQWRPVMVTISRNILHITENNQFSDSEQSINEEYPTQKFRLKNFKIEVGKCSETKYFCLFLVTGFTKITFGFEELELLEVTIICK